MTRRLNKLDKMGAFAAVLLLAGMVPAVAGGPEELIFRNETNGPIIVQGACVVRGVLRRDRPYLLKPGDATPPIALPGNKLITIYDGVNPNKVVYQGTIQAGQGNQFIGVSLDQNGAVAIAPEKPPTTAP